MGSAGSSFAAILPRLDGSGGCIGVDMHRTFNDYTDTGERHIFAADAVDSAVATRFGAIWTSLRMSPAERDHTGRRLFTVHDQRIADERSMQKTS